MLTVGDTLPEYEIIGVKPKFMKHEENGESAFETLKSRAETAAKAAEAADREEERLEEAEREFRAARRFGGRESARNRKPARKESFGSAIGQAVIKELKGTTGRRIVRGILGGFFKGR